MRIVVDMQGAQTESRFRGIGRYVLGFVKGVVRNRGEHEVLLVLSGVLPDTIERIRGEFDGLLPQENIRVWNAPGAPADFFTVNDTRRQVAEIIREAFIASLRPDILHICSFFEGHDAVMSLGEFGPAVPTSISLYDLIPLQNAAQYLDPHPVFAQHYYRKIESLKQASMLLAISDFTRQEGITCLKLPADRVVAVSTAIEGHFRPLAYTADSAAALRSKFGLGQHFLLYTGGCDDRKNLLRLIEAYSRMSNDVQDEVQLVFAGKIPEAEAERLNWHAQDAGLAPMRFRLLGYVSDDELLLLYNLCDAFVFPSWHEGFGLPVLEAMACGTPVICSGTSSLPEVIGREDVLFDPMDVESMTKKLVRVLRDEDWRKELREHGLRQARLFSWDTVGQRAIKAWESLPLMPVSETSDNSLLRERLISRLAEIADNEAMLSSLSICLAQNFQAADERQLLVDVSELCHHDAGTGVQRVVRNYLQILLQSPPAGYRVEPVYATIDGAYHYARRYTWQFLGLDAKEVTDSPMCWQRGDIFFALDMQHHVQIAHRAFYEEIMQQGVTVKFLIYDLLPIEFMDSFNDEALKSLHEQLLSMVAMTDGAICISRTTSEALLNWIRTENISISPRFTSNWVHMGVEDFVLAKGANTPQMMDVLREMGMRPGFLCVSTIEPRKRQEQVLDAFEAMWDAGHDVNLIFVGRLGWKMEAFAERMGRQPELNKRLFWLQGIDDSDLGMLYKSCTCLIAASLNEGFGLPLIEAAQHGLPVIARDIPVFREVAGEGAYYFSGHSGSELKEALSQWLALYEKGLHPGSERIVWSSWEESTRKLKTLLVQDTSPRQIFLDITELVQSDFKTGIQRVVRSILKEWLENPPAGYRVEPVYTPYSRPGHSYRYARRYAAQFTGRDVEGLRDEMVEFSPGDVFLGLDLSTSGVPMYADFYRHLRNQGVTVKFVVYDLLPLRLNYFEPPQVEAYSRWLQTIVESDGALCISKAVADELADWLQKNGNRRHRPFEIDWFHLGADIDNSMPTLGRPENAAILMQEFKARPTFMMVGTLEVRKGHAQVFEAFQQLWKRGEDFNLVIVGKQGWLVDKLVKAMSHHAEHGKRLFWLENASDEFLAEIYTACDCLIAASIGEGFGLPLIEAAQHELPIIARDIPVFREVAREHAFYFSGESGEALAAAIEEWVHLYQQGTAPTSQGMPWLTWKQSANCLKEKLLQAK